MYLCYFFQKKLINILVWNVESFWSSWNKINITKSFIIFGECSGLKYEGGMLNLINFCSEKMWKIILIKSWTTNNWTIYDQLFNEYCLEHVK